MEGLKKTPILVRRELVTTDTLTKPANHYATEGSRWKMLAAKEDFLRLSVNPRLVGHVLSRKLPLDIRKFI